MSPPEPSESAPDPLIGQVLGGKWRVVRLVGRGGMGAVYEGQNVGIGKRVALKLIDAEYARSPEVASRFQREAEAASLVESAHIVQVFDSGATDAGVPYIVMELLRGEDLRARIRRLGKLPVAEAVHVVAQVLRGLCRAHEAGIVHRDLKPDNVFLEARDDDPMFAKIVDFGISKIQRRPGEPSSSTLTRRGVVLGTPYYMSPEQAQAMPDLDARTDLFSVGAIMYECLAGRPPHVGSSYEQIIIGICTRDAEDPRRLEPSVPQAIAAFVMRALERDRDRRWPSAAAMLEGLRAAAPALVSTRSPTPVPLVPVAATPAQAPPEAPPAMAPATRVSWTTGNVSPSDSAASGSELSNEASRARARRSRTIAVGAIATASAFVATVTAMKLRAAGDPIPDASPRASAVAMPPPPPLESASAAITVVAPPASAPQTAVAPPSVHPVRKSAGSTAPSSVATAAATATTATTATVKAPGGVAGGLRIKTTYP